MHDDSANGLLRNSEPPLPSSPRVDQLCARSATTPPSGPGGVNEHNTGLGVFVRKGKRDEVSSSIEMIFGIPARCLAPHKFEACQNVKASGKGIFFFFFSFSEKIRLFIIFSLLTRGMMQAGHTPNKILPGRSCSIHFFLPP